MIVARHISKSLQYAVQLVLCVALLVNSVSANQAFATTYQESQFEQTNQSDTEEGDEKESSTTLMMYDAVVPVAQITLDHFFYIIREWKLTDANTQFFVHDLPEYVSSHFTTLFKRLISPNAP